MCPCSHHGQSDLSVHFYKGLRLNPSQSAGKRLRCQRSRSWRKWWGAWSECGINEVKQAPKVMQGAAVFSGHARTPAESAVLTHQDRALVIRGYGMALDMAPVWRETHQEPGLWTGQTEVAEVENKAQGLVSGLGAQEKTCAHGH